jgi:hypothetical protein
LLLSFPIMTRQGEKMTINFVSQSSLPESNTCPTEEKRTHRLPREHRPLTSAEWLAYFRANADRGRAVPWERGAEVTSSELTPIIRSLQLGETSDGSHLRAAAARYAEHVGDPAYARAVDMFIREEQWHGAMLGRFLDLAGVMRLTADWGDCLFRAVRYCITDMEVWTTPVVMVETLALVYYNAIRRATGSAVLRGICSRILSDEVPHLRFQCERLASLFQHRSPCGMMLTMLAQRCFFLAILLLVWLGHRRALRAGGYGWRRYWRAARDRMSVGWKLMDPRRYVWPE